MDKSISPLESHIGFLLRRVSNHVSDAFARELEAQGVSVAEWIALRLLLDSESSSPSELAQAMGMTQGAITKITEKLQRKGWVTINENQEDRRGRLLNLTPGGRKFVPKLADIADKNDANFFGFLSQTESNALRSLLNQLSEKHNWTDTPKI